MQRDGKRFVNYTCDFLWLGRCRGHLATALRLRGAALKAFVEIGTSAAVRAVLKRAMALDTSGLRAELDPPGGDAHGLDMFLRIFGEQLRAELRTDVKEIVADSIAAARESGVVELTRQHGNADAHRSDQEELLAMCQQLPSGAAGLETLRALGHLPVSTYLEQHFSVEEQYVLVHIMPVFAAELKQRKLDQAAALGEKPLIAWSQSKWRLVYTERDRDLMDALRLEEATQQRFRVALDLFEPVAGGARERPTRRGGRRNGPYSQGSSANVTRENVGRMFAASADR